MTTAHNISELISIFKIPHTQMNIGGLSLNA